MDAVSYSHADKQKQRIEKFIKQPDSTSGVVTVPDTIASGESIEIATGRQIVVDHLDVQGTLDIQGTLATVSGGYLSQTTMKTQAITHTNGTNAMTIDSSGNVGIGTSSPVSNLEVVGSTNSAGIVSVRPNGTGTLGVFSARNSSNTVNYSFGQIAARADKITIDSSKQGTGSYLPLVLGIGGGSSFMVDTLGNSLHINSTGGLGYGTGAGGAVTQLTSKSTAVTLNKPTGQITMNNAALAAGASVTFTFNNSLITRLNPDTFTINQLAGTSVNYDISTVIDTGAVYITVKNRSAGSLSEALILSFTITKGAAA